MEITAKKLNNKLKIIYAKDNSNPLISIQLHIRKGSAWETEKEAGFSHFTEHLVFKSTKKFPQNSLMEKVTFLGGHINAYTEYDSTCFYITLPSKYTKEGLEIISELAINTNFNEKDFQYEKMVIFEELKQYENEPEERFIEKIAELYLKKNPYRKPIIGNKNSLEKSNLQDLIDFYHKYYRPENAFLIVSGDFKENINDIVKEYFEKWKHKKVLLPEVELEKYPTQAKFISLPAEQNSDLLAFAHPDLSEIHPDSNALSFAVRKFAMGKNSRLYKILFINEKLVDAIKVHSISGILDGFATILIYPKLNADLNKIVKIVFEEWKKLLKFGLEESELRDLKREHLFSYKYIYEFIESVGFALGNEELIDKYERFLEYPDKIKALKLDKIDKVIKKYLNLKHVYLFHTGKKKIQDNLIKNDFLSDKIYLHKVVSEDHFNYTLPNGIKVIFKKVIGKPTVGIAASFKVSQLNENEKNRGINLLTSGLLMHSNQKQNYDQFLHFCSSNGLNCSILPQTETTTLNMKCFRENIGIALQQMFDMINLPLFSIDYFRNLQKTYISNLNRIKDYPQSFSNYLWRKMIFGANSNLVNREGTATSINSISMKQIKDWHQNFYLPGNFSIAVVGDFEFQKIIDQIEKLFTSSPLFTEFNEQKVLINSETQKYKVIDRNIEQSYINFGGFACNSLNIMKNTSFHVLAQIIGGEANSILFNELREKLGLVYSTDFSFSSNKQIGSFKISAITETKKEKKVLEVTKKILEELKTNGFEQNDLQKIKNFIRGNRLMEEESVLSQAITLANLEIMGYGYKFYLDKDKRLNEVTLEMLHRLAKEYFVPEKLYIHILR